MALKLILAVTIVLLIFLFLWWLLVTTEGVYLGRRVVIWLYDLYASRYDKIKAFDPVYEAAYLSHPLLAALAGKPAPLILDVATGTGRLPVAFFNEPRFMGQVVGLDLSRRMLAVAAAKLRRPLESSRAYLVHGPAETLPFPDNSFDIVACLEALEFMISPRAVIQELVRVARPGAILMLSNRQGSDARLFPGKTMSHARFCSMLECDFGLEAVKTETGWLSLYALVWAHKPGQAPMRGSRSLQTLMQCPRCKQIDWQVTATHWHCCYCRQQIVVGRDGVIELYSWQRGQVL